MHNMIANMLTNMITTTTMIVMMLYLTTAFPTPSAYLLPKPEMPCAFGEKWPRSTVPYDLPSFNHLRVYTRQDAKVDRRLAGRVRRLECMIQEICCAISYSDDIGLMEREMLKSGDIYLDSDLNMTRDPMLLRRAIANISRKYGNPVSAPEHFWHRDV